MSFIKSGIIVGLFTLISRITGLFREISLAYFVGANTSSDILNLALKLPNLFRRIFAEGALSASFIPSYSSLKSKSIEEANYFASRVMTALLILTILIVIPMIIYMDYILILIAPGFYNNILIFKKSVTLCRITIPYLVFISIISFIGGILNSYRYFFSFAISPVILNICIIVFTYFSSFYENKEIIISFGVIISGLIQIILMLVFIRIHKINIYLVFPSFDRNIKYFLSRLLPAAMSAGLNQINLFIANSIATLVPGAISILSYAERIYQLPLSLIGATISTILLPALTKIIKNDNKNIFYDSQVNILKLALFITLPCSFGIITISHPITYLIFERGAFNSQDTLSTSITICCFSIGLPAFTLNKIFLQYFYAKFDTKNPMKISLYTVLVNIILNLIFFKIFGYLGIAFATSIASWFNIFLLGTKLKLVENKILQKCKIFILKTTASSFIMSIITYLFFLTIKEYIYNGHLYLKIISIFSNIIIGIITYFFVSYKFKHLDKNLLINLRNLN